MTKRIRILAALACALLAACCLSTAALADDPSAPSWNLNIPADVAIAYRATDSHIGDLTVSDVENVGAGYYIACMISNSNLTSGTDTIPLGVALDWYQDGTCVSDHMPAGTVFALYSSVVPDMEIRGEIFTLVDDAAWDAAAPGEYEATVTYHSWLGSI